MANRKLGAKTPLLLAALLFSTLGIVILAGCGGESGEGEVSEPTAVGEASEQPEATEQLEAAPDFELPLFGNANYTAGDTLTLSELEGRPIVLNFWFPSCPPCVAEMPDLDASFQEHKDVGLAFIGVQLIGVDSEQNGQEFVDRLGVTYALGPDRDGEIAFQKYEVQGFPTTFFLNADHGIVRKWSGPLNREKLEELVAEILP